MAPIKGSGPVFQRLAKTGRFPSALKRFDLWKHICYYKYKSNLAMMKLVQYLDNLGRSPFESWFKRINAQAAAKITTALVRLEGGNFSNIKSLGSGVYELKVDFGLGYRVYYGYDGQKIVVLLAGGTKKRQNKDIETAKKRWADYKTRKKKEI